MCIIFHNIEVVFSLSAIYIIEIYYFYTYILIYVYYIFKIEVVFVWGGGVIVFSVFVIQISLNILHCYLHTCIQYTHGYMSCKHCLTKGYVSNIIFVEHKKQTIT